MKKSILASVIALGLVSGLTHAAENEVQFVGSVVKTTCDLEASGTGPNAGLVKNVIELGQATTGMPGKDVNFAFKPVNEGNNVQNCAQLAQDGISTVALTWNSNAFNGTGLAAISGTASDAYVEVKATNAKVGNDEVMTTSGAVQEFDATKLSSEGLQYQAKLIGGNKPGDFKTASKFTFYYK